MTTTQDRPPTRVGTEAATGGRLRSVDVARGLVVGLSAILSHLADPSYTFARHADWYGLHLIDLILPAFLCLFGVGIALAYRGGVRWGRLVRRTALLLVIGLAFNAVVAWQVDPATWRFTGVLQLFAVVGVLVTLVTRVAPRWWQALLIGAGLLTALQLLLVAVGTDCVGGLPQPGCTPSGRVDPAVFGAPHLYRQFAHGYDPEGLPVVVGACATVLFGYAAGELLWRHRARGAVPRLAGLVALLLAALPLLAAGMPVNKRLWTPAFALVTAAATIGLLLVAHLTVDRLPVAVPRTAAAVRAASWLPEAFGRNSLLVYFGKYLVAAVLAHVALASWTDHQPVADWLHAVLRDATARPAVAYAAVMFGGWAVVSAVLHRARRYLRV